MRPEESWRRTDPEIFLLPENELLNFAGNPVVQTAGQTLLPWKVTFLAAAEMESYFSLCSKYVGSSGIEVLKNEMPRLIFIHVGSGLARVFISESLRSGVEFQSSPWEPASVAPNSPIGLMLSKRLKQCTPHEFVITLTSKANETPCVVLCNELEPNYAQSFSKIKFVVTKNSKAQIVLLEGGSSFSMSNHSICVEENAQVTQIWAHRNENAVSNLLERTVTLKENSKFWDAQILCCGLDDFERGERSAVYTQREAVHKRHSNEAQSHPGRSPQKGNVRVTSNVILDGVKAQAESAAVVVASGGKFDYEPIQEHKAHSTKSHLKLKMILSQRARAIFEGLVIVHKEAQKSQALQENKNLLLSSTARVDATPRLEILPNDVACKHGSATGELDSKQLYYLTSRGFSPEQAKNLLIQSFGSEVFSKLESESVPQQLAQCFLDAVLSSSQI